ncbi:hypothetical protein DXT63_17775, partial [Thermoanaerobacteraceae bacterium SP2]
SAPCLFTGTHRTTSSLSEKSKVPSTGEIVINGDGTVQGKTKEKYKLQTHHLSGGLLLASGAPETEKNTVPNETQVKSAYQQAVEAYGWFDMICITWILMVLCSPGRPGHRYL